MGAVAELPADGLVIRWTTRWWDPLLGAYAPPADDIAVYADGTVIGASTVDAEAQPMIWPYVTGTIPVDDVRELLERAAAAGLLDAPTTRDANAEVTGAPVTFVTVRSAAGSATHAVHALQTPSQPELVGGAALRDLITELRARTAEALDPVRAPFAELDRVAVLATRAPEASGTDPWPGGVPLADARPCVVLDEADTIAALRQRLAGHHFTDRGVTYPVRAYELLPDEHDCFGPLPAAEQPADEVDVIRISVQPLFPVTPPFVGAGPQVLVYADGTVLTEFEGAFDVRPMVWPYRVGRIEPGQVAALRAAAEAAGLGGEPIVHTVRPDVADAPVTTVTLAVGGRRVSHQVAALASPAADEPAAVRALREFTASVAAAVEPLRAAGTAPDHRPRRVAVASAPVDVPVGTARPWPGDWPPGGFSACNVVDDPVVIAELTSRPAGQHYVAAGTTFAVAARVAFPGDAGC